MDEALISVDRWVKGSQAYFLTHLHADHTKGLSSTWSHAPLYCSSFTADLIPLKFSDFDLSLLHVFEIGTWQTLNLISRSSGAPTAVEFIAIDACHCPGSVMLLFRGEFGCMLYTGDFRWEVGCERAAKAKEMLAGAIKDDKVDVVYLDNTYCNPIYDFPNRQVAAQQIIDIIASHPDHDVIIGINTLGKEDLLVQISEALKIKIWVWPERMWTMDLLGFYDNFTINTSITRVRAVPQYSFNVETLEELNRIKCPTIGIMPSGLPWVKKSPPKTKSISRAHLTARCKKAEWSEDDDEYEPMGDIGPPEKLHKYIFTVPYSDHSNFAEIMDFVKLIRPKNLKGIVSSSSCYIEPMYYLRLLCQGNRPSEVLNSKLKRKARATVAGSNKKPSGSYNAELVRKRSMTLKARLKRIRLSKHSILRKVRKGAKIPDISADLKTDSDGNQVE
ncbi:uncharacterized protein LOC107477834 [Arachis duranensis]|uniref:Protein artemis n=1 Tax=Arachis duranensis TaxID=130453 RepID=A0A6P4CMS6_ARADU|nr:uncharacterized protein LOC107477834 [Arachis duranensis]